METLEQLGIVLGLTSLAGLNLYLTVFLSGCAVRFGWIDLIDKFESLSVLGNGWVLGVAGVLFVIEFFADKIPWVDSAWDAVHTIVRPAGGIFLSFAALGELDPAMAVIAALLAGGTSFVTHTAKAGTRLLINASPEPVSNIVASVVEDGIVIGGLSLIAIAPVTSFFVFVVFVTLCVIVIRKVWGSLRRGIAMIKGKVSRKKIAV